jgi:hypothetical protein
MVRLLEQDIVFNLETHLYTIDGAIKRFSTPPGSSGTKGNRDGIHRAVQGHNLPEEYRVPILISERNFTILFDTILSSSHRGSPRDYILNINTTAEKIYGYSWEDIVGEQFDWCSSGRRASRAFSG